MNLLEQIKIKSLCGNSILSTNSDSDLPGDYVVDTKDCDGVLFLLKYEAIASTAILGLTAMHSNSTSTTDLVAVSSDLCVESTVGSTDQSFGFLALDLYRPVKRYVGAKIEKDTADSTVSSLIAISYGLRKQPSVQSTGIADTVGGAGVIASKVAVSPTT